MPDKPIDRVPNLPKGKMVDEQGYPSPEEALYRQQNQTFMQDYLGSEGLVAPTQTNADLLVIQNATMANPSDPLTPLPTCRYGTILYDSTNNTMRMAIDDGSGNPVFKTVTLT